jgi:phosphatidylglycerol:prolipoprotein diacylglycerol transferase
MNRRLRMHPVLFELGFITVYSYGFMIAIGIISAVLLSIYRGKKAGMNTDVIMNLGIYGLVGGFIGAKLLFWITEFPNIIDNPNYIIETLSSGFVVYGGIIGGFAAGYSYCKIKHLDFLLYIDLIVPAIALAQGFGRIGCFEAGCCYGRETNRAFGIIFHNSLIAPNGISLVPTQLYSSAGAFILAGTLLYFASRMKRKGQVAGLYMILYSIGRFVIEIFREDQRGTVGNLSTSQFICIFMFLIGMYVFCFLKRNDMGTNTEKSN